MVRLVVTSILLVVVTGIAGCAAAKKRNVTAKRVPFVESSNDKKSAPKAKPTLSEKAAKTTLPKVKKPKNLKTNLHKANTIVLLALDPYSRADRLVHFVLDILSTEQLVNAREIVVTYDSEFDEIRDRRSQIMLSRLSRAELDSAMTEIDAEVIQLSKKIRGVIRNKILTADQRVTLREKHLASAKSKKP